MIHSSVKRSDHGYSVAPKTKKNQIQISSLVILYNQIKGLFWEKGFIVLFSDFEGTHLGALLILHCHNNGMGNVL